MNAIHKEDVQIGGMYAVRLSGKYTYVRIDRKCDFGGWYATNVNTGREVRIKSAAKLRREIKAN